MFVKSITKIKVQTIVEQAEQLRVKQRESEKELENLFRSPDKNRDKFDAEVFWVRKCI